MRRVDFTSGTTTLATGAVGDFNGDNRQDIVAADTIRFSVLQRVCNNAPGFTSVTNQIRAQGASSNSQIATVSDPETAAGSLTVTATTVPAGITVSSIVNTNGTITATVGAGGGTATGDYTVVLTVSDGGLSTNANLTVTVVSATQEIVVKGSNVIITDGDATPSAADNTDFGQVALANTRERTFTIENVGATALTIQNGDGDGRAGRRLYGHSATGCFADPLFGTTTFKIRVAPTALGLHSTTVTFANNDADENPFNFTIQATGIAAPTLGDYANTSIALGGNTTITPTAAPTNQTYATATTTAGFQRQVGGRPGDRRGARDERTSGKPRGRNLFGDGQGLQCGRVDDENIQSNGDDSRRMRHFQRGGVCRVVYFSLRSRLLRRSEISTATAGRILFSPN